MKNGNWVPISKAGKKHLPHDRPYTELEAMFSLQCDADEGKAVTVLGYANLWRWSRKKVMRFMDDAGVEIEYPDPKKRNQKGHIRIHKRDIKGTNEGHIFPFKSKTLGCGGDIKGTNEGHIRDISGYTTINNKEQEQEQKRKKPSASADAARGNGKPFYLTKKKKRLTGWKLDAFNRFWQSFGYMKGKAEAADAWLEVVGLDEETAEAIITGAGKEAERRQEIIDRGGTPKMAQGWLSGRRWEDDFSTNNQQRRHNNNGDTRTPEQIKADRVRILSESD